MNLRRGGAENRRAFTLIEMLVVIGIIAILGAVALPFLGRTRQQADVVKTLSNMRQMGTAMFSYTNDNNALLPNRAQNINGNVPDRWPVLLQPYLQDPRVYVSPVPDVGGKSYRPSNPNRVFDNSTNFTSCIYNGMNDRGALDDPTVAVRINTIEQPTMTILLGIPLPQTGQFYMDFSEGGGNNNEVLNKKAFPGGSVYMFCDGSSRLLVATADAGSNLQQPSGPGIYTDWLWLTDKSRSDIIQGPH